MEITKEMKIEVLNELYNTFKDSAYTQEKSVIIHSILQDIIKGPTPSNRPLILM